MSKSSKTSIIWGTIACILTFSSAYTQIEKRDFAPYCSLYYKASGGPADILVGEIKPTISAPYTYYNVLTWSGGYTGLQMTEQGPGFIFSLWDPPGSSLDSRLVCGSRRKSRSLWRRGHGPALHEHCHYLGSRPLVSVRRAFLELRCRDILRPLGAG